MLFQCKDLVLEIAKHFCIQQLTTHYALLCKSIAHAVLTHKKWIIATQNEFRCMLEPHIAASRGHLKCLQHVYERGISFDQDKFTRNACHTAAFYGHLDCLIYAHTHGCPLTRGTLQVARAQGHVKIATYVASKIAT